MQKTEDSHEVVFNVTVSIKEEAVENEIDNSQNVDGYFVNKPAISNNKVISNDESHRTNTSSNASHSVNELAVAIDPTTVLQIEYNIKDEIYIAPKNEVHNNFIESNKTIQTEYVKNEIFIEISNEVDDNFIESNDSLKCHELPTEETTHNREVDCLENIDKNEISISSKGNVPIFKQNTMKSLKSVAIINDSDIAKRDSEKAPAPIAQQHSEERPYPCEQCDNAYTTRSNLNKHHRRVHQNQVHKDLRTFSCDICGKVFKEKYNLQLHKARVHTEARPYPCEQCSLTFKTQQYLKLHLHRVHLSGRSFGCDICGKMFKTKSDIQAHIKVVHSEARPYPCEQCGMAFKTSWNLKCHLQWTHMPADSNAPSHTCEQCGKSFKKQRYLKCHQQFTHMPVDSNARSYTCTQCGKGFKLPGMLKSHLRVHTPDTDKYLYTCYACGKEYRYKNGLQKHLKSSHKNVP